MTSLWFVAGLALVIIGPLRADRARKTAAAGGDVVTRADRLTNVAITAAGVALLLVGLVLLFT